MEGMSLTCFCCRMTGLQGPGLEHPSLVPVWHGVISEQSNSGSAASGVLSTFPSAQFFCRKAEIPALWIFLPFKGKKIEQVFSLET